ncbi:phosphatidylserine/phosphatidylglycerophosphate/cardiolipin synthase family protein [uncultured Paracoccus sp.]|uniref:phospholipase D-like domain-containing protein n=1 Tax=uncultured Paracoccus sp. TaxID=189685 RepID=UPI0026081A88|nr:phospholipase D family protein [uncultured Paracoccus sp.]
MRWIRILLVILLALLLVWVAGRLIFAVPSTEGRAVESAIPFDPTTTLGPQAVEAMSAHAGKSGVVPLPDGQGALMSRMKLAEGAERSIDAMYYIWHDDTSGMLLLDALRDAAERGVRVRLLLDDNGIAGMDSMLAALNELPNFSVRLFNPSTVRNPKGLGYALYPLRMNRRMHNKAFLVDGAVAIVGGRNIGDEYFAIGDVPAYLDLDVLGVGDVVTDTAAIFDQYWNSEPVLALEQVIAGRGDMAAFDKGVAEAEATPEAQTIIRAEASAGERMVRRNAPQMEWTEVQVVADDPVKGMGTHSREDLMMSRLGAILGSVTTRLDLISAYFVPGKAGSGFFSKLAESGVDVRIMTNSWQATDVPMVHAGYVKYRRELLEAGVTLYELKPIEGIAQGRAELRPSGFSGSSLHAKTFSVDDRRVFIGSFNFDPRSAALNCEMGFLIDSPAIAKAGSTALTDGLSRRSFQPELEGNKMVWRDPQPDGSVITLEHEPDLDVLDRVAVYVLNVLPIEWLL